MIKLVFLIFHDDDGKLIYINVEKLCWFSLDKEGNFTNVCHDSGVITVKETPEQIQEMLEKSLCYN